MKGKMRLRFFSLAILILLVGLTACGTAPNDTMNQGNQDTNSAGPDSAGGTSGENDGQTDVKMETKLFTIYYSDEQLLKIVDEEHEIQFSSQGEMLRALWSSLQNPNTELSIDLWEGVTLLEGNIEEEKLTLNISLPTDLQLGSSGEGLAIQTLIQTYGQIEEVETIQLLVDGKVQETLAGHVSIDQPLSKDEIIYKGE